MLLGCLVLATGTGCQMAANGNNALVWEGGESQHGYLPKMWLRTKGNSIEGGTSEIQLNIVAKRILGLPG